MPSRPWQRFAGLGSVTSVWCVFLLVPVLSFPAFAAALRVDIRDSEVWLIGAGHERQITDDGNRKHGARLSPSAKRIAYVQQCDPQRRDCNAGIVGGVTGCVWAATETVNRFNKMKGMMIFIG